MTTIFEADMMTTTAFFTFFPPILHRRGEDAATRLAISEGKVVTCKGCGQPLIEIDFNSTHYAHLCNNWHCRLFLQPQGSRAKDSVPKEILPEGKFDSLLTNYHKSLERRKERYQFARSLGFNSKRAMKLRDSTVEEIKYLAGVEVEA